MYPSPHILFRLSTQEVEECGACDLYGGEEKCMQGFGEET